MCNSPTSASKLKEKKKLKSVSFEYIFSFISFYKVDLSVLYIVYIANKHHDGRNKELKFKKYMQIEIHYI